MARDIGGMFERMTRRAAGGRRLDADRTADDDDRDDRHDRDDRRDRGGAGGRGVADVLKEIVGKGRTTARTTAERIRATSRGAGSRTATRRELPPEGSVRVEYSPDMHDGDPDPGEVVWTWVPFEEDPDQGKDRPVVVIGRRGRSLVGIPLTTKRNDREAQISIGTGAWDPKRRASYVRVWRMLDLVPGRMRREGAVLPRSKFDQIVAAVDEYYDVHVTRATDRSADDD